MAVPAVTPGTTLVNPFNRETSSSPNRRRPRSPSSRSVSGRVVQVGGMRSPTFTPKQTRSLRSARVGWLSSLTERDGHSDPARRSLSRAVRRISSSTLMRATPKSCFGSRPLKTTSGSSSLSQWRPKPILSGSDRKGSRSSSGWPWPCTRSRITCMGLDHQSGFRSCCLRRSRP